MAGRLYDAELRAFRVSGDGRTLTIEIGIRPNNDAPSKLTKRADILSFVASARERDYREASHRAGAYARHLPEDRELLLYLREDAEVLREAAKAIELLQRGIRAAPLHHAGVAEQACASVIDPGSACSCGVYEWAQEWWGDPPVPTVIEEHEAAVAHAPQSGSTNTDS